MRFRSGCLQKWVWASQKLKGHHVVRKGSRMGSGTMQEGSKLVLPAPLQGFGVPQWVLVSNSNCSFGQG